MTSDNMIRVGRGGAGNYHAAPANKSPAPPSKSELAFARQPAAAPTLTGRGGAGNVLSEPNAAAHADGQQQRDLEVGEDGAQMTATEAAASVAAAHHQQQQHGTLGGRGGAGNWRDAGQTEAAEAMAAEQAEQRAQASKKAAAEVDNCLRRPEPTHTRTRHCERN